MDKEPGIYFVPDNSLSDLCNYYSHLVELTFNLIDLLVTEEEFFKDLPFKFDMNPYKQLMVHHLRDFLYLLDKCELWNTVYGSEDRDLYENVIQHFDGYY